VQKLEKIFFTARTRPLPFSSSSSFSSTCPHPPPHTGPCTLTPPLELPPPASGCLKQPLAAPLPRTSSSLHKANDQPWRREAAKAAMCSQQTRGLVPRQGLSAERGASEACQRRGPAQGVRLDGLLVLLPCLASPDPTDLFQLLLWGRLRVRSPGNVEEAQPKERVQSCTRHPQPAKGQGS